MKKIIMLILVMLVLVFGYMMFNNTDKKDIESTEVFVEELVDNIEVESIEVDYLNSDMINIDFAMNLISELSSEEYLGRQAGTDENLLVEDVLAKKFEELGLISPEGLVNYKQPYEQKVLLPVRPTEISIEGQDISYEYQVDFTERFYVGTSYYDKELTADMVFIMSGESLKENIEELDHKILLMTQEVFFDAKTFLRLESLQKNGVTIEAIFIESDAAPSGGMRVSRALRGDDDYYFEEEDPVVFNCSKSMFSDLIALSESDTEIFINIDFDEIDTMPSNVVGIIPGKNEVGDDETIIIGAHLDHVGNNMNGTFNGGALDNASGISVLVELARIIKLSGQPEDTIIFVAFNGEEDGLLGSKYFVENPPIEYNSDNTVMLNFDMVGSTAKIPLLLGYIDYDGKKLGDSIATLAEEINIDYEIKASYGSDHVRFAEAGITSIMFIHFDDEYYHTYLDTIENAISSKRLENIIKLALEFVEDLAY